MSFKNIQLSILYGSQTGNAQDLAERIWRESKRFYFQSSVLPLNEYNVVKLPYENFLIFICSTTGQGNEPDNMKSFWKFLLKRNLSTNLLSNVRFAVLGLGDSSYVKFNFVAKRLQKRLIQLGGEPLIPLGLGDDQHDLGYDAVADPWIDNLWRNLLNCFPLPNNIQPLNKNLPILPRWNVQKNGQLLTNSKKLYSIQSMYYSTRKSNEFTTEVLENVRQTDESHFQDVRLIKLKTNGEKYNPGDLIVLRPRNLDWQIEEFKTVLKTNGIIIPDEQILNLNETDSNLPIPDVLKFSVTFKQLCEEYFDLFSIPRRSVFEILAQLTDSELEKEKCLEFSTAEGQQEMYTYTNRPKRNIVEVLRDFPHATKHLTIDMLFEILPPIKPREFSIASSFTKHTNQVHILLAVVRYKTNLVKERFGLASNYLANLNTGDCLTAWIKKGSLRFPKELTTPVILIGPGTGVAPFRNFILENSDKSNYDTLLLFYGCRFKEKDFICKDDFLELDKQKKMTLICAFSRDQDHKIYVQDKIEEHGNFVWKILEKNTQVFVAGNSKNMPQSVRKAFVNVCIKYGRLTAPEAEKFIEKMEKENRYQTECW